MSHQQPKTAAPAKPRSFGWIAEFDNEHALLVAARKVRDSGYTKTDAYTPFPVHGIDEALGIKPTILPFIVLACGLTGLCTAILFQCWSNGIDYPYIISGKPFFSIPAFIPVTFETTVLFSAFATFLGMWGLNGLPRFSNPVFTNSKFDRVTDDRFFLHVDAADKYYNRESVRELLAGTQPLSLEEVMEDSSPTQLPSIIWLSVLTLLVAALIPLAIVANMRASTDEKPRWHVWFDMDFQPKKKAQSSSTIFADNRASRPQVVGTIARGQLEQADPFYLGYDPSKQAALPALGASGVRLVSAVDEPSGQESPKAPKLETPVDEPATPEAAKPAVKEVETADDKTPGKSDSKETVAKDAKGEAPAEGKGAERQAAASADEPPTSSNQSKVAKEPAPASAAKEPASKEPAKTNAAQPAQAASGIVSPATPVVSGGPNLAWLTEFPLELTTERLSLGQTKFETYCAVCHGYAGDGDGLVHRRAEQLQQGTWLPPTSMHEQRIREQAVGNIFYTISNGKGKMASYAAVLTPEERWAVVMYVRALQRSRNASIEDVPVDRRAKIEEVKKVD
jgi:mono/diheme cytochrome c family protein